MALIPDPVLEAYGLAADRVETISGGLINATFLVRGESDEESLVVQRLHPIFAGRVNLDIEAVTEHLASRQVETPRLVRTGAGEPWMEIGDEVWRALSYVGGTTLARVDDPAQAESAGYLVGRFHRATADLDHDFHFTRAGVHDTPAHLARLRAVSAAGGDTEVRAAETLRRDILEAADHLPELPVLSRRICHGDLKISNVRFSSDRRSARCLIDLDTLGRQTIAFELGDALRSWANPDGEDRSSPQIDVAIVEAALRGYAAGCAGLLSAAEIAAIGTGLETVCVELAARFCVDVFDDSYFGWDPQRYPSRRAHNLERARGQLALARSVRAARRSIDEAAAAAFAVSS